MRGGVPAVSNARRRVDRLQGGQHCRRALEIRSEVSAPALMVPRYLGTVRKVSSLLFSGSGGLGLRVEALRIFRAFHLRPPSLATAGSARTRQGTLGSLDSPSAAASSDERRFFTRRRRKPRPSRRSAVSSLFASTRNAPQRSSRHHGGADRVAQARQQLRAGSACRSGCLNCILQFKFARKLARPPSCVRNARQKIGDFRP